MTRKMAETSRGATVRNVPGTRSEARRSERSVTFVTLGSEDDSEDREYVRGLFEAEYAEAMSYEGHD